MAKNTTTLNKFLTGTATAALVATAIVPVAAANDTAAEGSTYTDVASNNDHYENIMKARTYELMTGYTDGTFEPARQLTRSNVVKALGKYVIAQSGGTIEEYDVSDVKPFADTPSTIADKELYNYSLIVKKANIFSGSNNNLEAAKLINRQQMAKVLVNAFGLKDLADKESKVTDNEKAFAEYVPFINILSENEVTAVTKFMPLDYTSRAQFASFLVRAFEIANPVVGAPEVIEVSAINGTVTVTLDQEVTEVAAADFKVFQNGKAVTPSSVVLGADKKTVTITVPKVVATNVEQNVVTSVSYKEGEAKAAAAFKVASNVVPVVESVMAINANQIVVNFNTTLNSDKTVTGDASEANLYTLGTDPASSAVLSSDKKSVTLTFVNDVEGPDQVLVVNPIATNAKDANGTWVSTEKYSTILSYTDTVKPVITNTSYENGFITLTFSEKLSAEPTVVRVNNEPISVGEYSVEGNTVVITKSLNASQTASLYVAGALDTANTANEMAIYNGSVTAPSADMEKPRVTSVQVTGENTAKVTLSEDVVEDNVNVILQKGSDQTPTQLVRDKNDTTGKTYTLTVAGLFPSGSTSTSEEFTLFVENGVMTDQAGLKNAFFSTSVTFVKDTTAPTLSSTRVTAGNEKLEFLFSEGLVVQGADSEITIRNSQGVNFTADVNETTLNAANSSNYLVDFKAGTAGLDAGTYTVTFPAGFFTDAQGNATAAVSSTIVVPGTPASVDNKKPTATVVQEDNTVNEFTVTYTEEVSSNALSASSYRLDGQALPAGTDIYFKNAEKEVVIIVLPEGSVNIGNQTDGAPAVLTLLNTTDLAGNVIDTMNYNVTITDNKAATISSVQVAGDVVVVTFTEAIEIPSTVDANNVFNVSVAGVVADAGNLEVVDGNENQVKFTLATAPSGTVNATVQANQIVLTDENGVAVK